MSEIRGLLLLEELLIVIQFFCNVEHLSTGHSDKFFPIYS
jgi:hypothetical protein